MEKHTGKQRNRGAPRVHQRHIFRGHAGGWLHAWTHQVLYLRLTNPKYSPLTWVTISVTYELERKAEARLAGCRVILTFPDRDFSSLLSSLWDKTMLWHPGKSFRTEPEGNGERVKGTETPPGDSRPLWVQLAACYSNPLSHQREKIS